MVNDFWISFVVVCLVCYRLSRMIAAEEGPFEIFTWFRTWVYNGKFPVWVQHGVICPLCISFWVALPLAFLMTYQMRLDWYAVLYLWFAISGAASFLYKVEK